MPSSSIKIEVVSRQPFYFQIAEKIIIPLMSSFMAGNKIMAVAR